MIEEGSVVSLPSEQPLDEHLASQSVVQSDVGQDTCERADAKAVVARNGDVMFAGLTGHAIAEIPERSRQLVTGKISRKPQTPMTSSRTK